MFIMKLILMRLIIQNIKLWISKIVSMYKIYKYMEIFP